MNRPVLCNLWHWRQVGSSAVHERCSREAAVRSEVPGRIAMQTCVPCHHQRTMDQVKEKK